MKIPRKVSKIKTKTVEVSLIVDNVRSSENVGSFFRTADALGISKIYLIGYTPKPLDKFNRPDSKIAKTALGAEKVISYESYATINPLIKKLKKDEVMVLALEQDKNSIDYRKLNSVNFGSKDSKKDIALIVGNEVTGISKSVLKQCDVILEIPMLGIKESLNVSVATGMALAELTRNIT